MKTIWTETPKGEEAQQEWIGSQSRHRLPMVQITKNGCLKINKPLQELLPPYFQLSYSPQNQELLLRESTLEDGGIRMGKTFVKLLPLSRKLHRCGVELPAYFEVGHVPVGKIWHGKLRQIPDEKLLASIYKDQKNPLGKRRGVPRLWSGFWNGMPLSVKRLSKIVPSPSLSKIAGKRLN